MNLNDNKKPLKNWHEFSGQLESAVAVIPDGVTSIECGAFRGCGEVETISIPESVTEISEYAFDGCDNLTAIAVDESNRYFMAVDGILYDRKQETLLRCPEAKCGSVVVPETVIAIEYKAFGGCSALTEITLPKYLSRLADEAFCGCAGITHIRVPEVIEVGDWAFSDCTALVSAEISDGVMYIGDCAFSGCSSLESVTMPDSVDYIPNSAFDGCPLLDRSFLERPVTEP